MWNSYHIHWPRFTNTASRVILILSHALTKFATYLVARECECKEVASDRPTCVLLSDWQREREREKGRRGGDGDGDSQAGGRERERTGTAQERKGSRQKPKNTYWADRTEQTEYRKVKAQFSEKARKSRNPQHRRGQLFRSSKIFKQYEYLLVF